MFRVIVFGLIFMVAATAHASVAEGKVKYIRARASDGLTWIDIEGARSARPACAQNNYMMIRDENSEVGKKQFAILLQAHATGKSVIVYGANNCSRWSDGESIETVEAIQ